MRKSEIKTSTLLVLLFLGESFQKVPPLVKEDLYILVMAPWSNYQYDDPAWNIGPALFPAARLASDQINSRPDMLQGYNLRLIERESGCSLTSKTMINFIDAAFYGTQGNRIVGMIGPGCSESLFATSQQIRRPALDFAQLSISSSSSEVSGPEHLNSFGVVPPTSSYVEAVISLMRQAAWKKIAVVYDHRNAAYSHLFSETRKKIDRRMLHPIELQDQVQHDYIFKEVDSRNIKIILVLTGLRAAQNILCDKAKYHKVQLIFVDLMQEDILNLYLFQHSRCTLEQLKISLNNTIFLTNDYQRSNTETSSTLAQISYQVYEEFYNAYLDSYLSEQMIPKENLPLSRIRYSSAFYDAMWALALALNESLEDSNNNKSGNAALGKRVRESLELIRFEGMSGLLYFNKTSRAIPSIGIIANQTIWASGEKWEFRTGNYVTSESSDFNVTHFEFLPYKKTILAYHVDDRIAFVILAIAVVAVVCFFILQIMFLSLQVKAISPQLDYLILSGCCLYLVALVLSTVQAVFPNRLDNYTLISSISCNLQYWCLSVAFTLIFCTICAKTYRIYRIFTHFRQGTVKYVSDPFLISIIIGLVIVDFSYLMTWTLTNPWILAKWVRREGSRIVDYHYCFCENIEFWLTPLLIQKMVLIFAAVILSILVRPVKKEGFKNTKAILILIYLLIFIHTVGLSIYALLESLQTLYILKYLAYSLTFVLTLVSITLGQFVTHMWPILYRKKRTVQSQWLTSMTSHRTHSTHRRSLDSTLAPNGV